MFYIKSGNLKTQPSMDKFQNSVSIGLNWSAKVWPASSQDATLIITTKPTFAILHALAALRAYSARFYVGPGVIINAVWTPSRSLAISYGSLLISFWRY